ncbi:hypothetical protein [Pikeienuella sp. HZG-20]
MQRGAVITEVESAFGVTEGELRRIYWIHPPHYQKSVTDALERRKR